MQGTRVGARLTRAVITIVLESEEEANALAQMVGVWSPRALKVAGQRSGNAVDEHLAWKLHDFLGVLSHAHGVELVVS